MTTLSQVEEYRRSQGQVSDVARRELRLWWAGLDKSDPDAVRAAVETVLPQLVGSYGELAGEVAASWYDELNLITGDAEMASPIPGGQTAASGRWALGSMFRGDPASSLLALEGVVDRLVKQAGRDTIIHNADRDGLAWARIPSGKETCAFCRMLASRGAVYGSSESAGSGNRYHAHCDCVPTPIPAGEPYPPGYDPEAYYAEYAKARAEAGSGDTKEILSHMRANEAAVAAAAPAAKTVRAVVDMSDDELEEALGAAWAADDMAEADRLMQAMDGREKARLALPASRADAYTESVVSGWTDEDFDDELMRLMRPDINGWVDQPAIERLGGLMDEREKARKADDELIAGFAREAAERKAARELLDGKPRRKPKTVDQQLRADYDEYVHVEWLKAEDDCNGVLLNPAGRAAGVDPKTLWQGNTARARKYASEELKSFWQRNGRANYGTFRADALGRASDRGVRDAASKEGWYDSVG